MPKELPSIRVVKKKLNPEMVCIIEKDIEIHGNSLKKCFEYVKKVEKEV